METTTLETVIRQHISLPAPNAKGWHNVVHPKCDHGKKGARSAFLFDNSITVFKCYNCGVTTKYDPSTHKSIPHKMLAALDDFGIHEHDLQAVVFSNFGKLIKATKSNADALKLEPKHLIPPKIFYLLDDAPDDDIWANKAKKYLDTRGIDWKTYPFIMSKQSDDMLMRKWFKRLIIPIFKQHNLIYYQGRDLTGKSKKKYQNPKNESDNVLYGFDNLLDYSRTDPIYVVEGWFDAFIIDGVALLGNVISKEQAAWLNKFDRKKVYIPDRFGDGKAAALHALSLGWSISTPDIGSDTECKDINDIAIKYGKLYTMKTLAEQTTDSKFEATVKLRFYCK